MKKMNYRQCLRLAARPILTALVAGALTVSCFAAHGVIINAEDGLRMRSSASTTASVVASLPNGSTVDVLETSGDWYRVRSGQKEGYVSKEYIRLTDSTGAKYGYTTDKVNVRKAAGTNQSKVGSLDAGTKVEILSTANGWHKIKAGDITGFVSADYISNSAPSSSSSTKYGYTTDKVNVRKAAGTDQAKVGSLDAGTKVEILSTANGWHKIKAGDITGFVSADYIGNSAPSSSSSTKYGYATDNVNVRKAAGTDQPKVGSLDAGTKVEILSTANGWHKIKSGDITGFVSADYISDTAPSAPSTKYGYATSNVNVRKAAGTNQSKVGSLSSGTKVEILSTADGWHKIKAGNITGYVSADYISDSPNGTKYGYTTAKVNVRKGPGTDQDKVTVLSSGTKVEIVSTADGWHKIKSGDTTGYILAEYISDTAPSTPSTKYGYTTDKVNVRKGPGTDQDKVTILNAGTKVEILSTADGWHKIKSGNVTGYISAEYISDNAPGSSSSTKNYGFITTSSLNVRKGPGSSYAKVTALSADTKVEILGVVNNWYHIKSGNTDGYVSTKYVRLENESSSIPTEQAPSDNNSSTSSSTSSSNGKNYGYITSNTLNVRKGPSSSYDKVVTLTSGTKVEVVGVVNNWYHIKSGNAEGYVYTGYVRLDSSAGSIPKEQAPASSSSSSQNNNSNEDDNSGSASGDSSKQSQVVAYARKFLGYPYVLGARGPKSFDCSGLVQYVYKHFGYNINRTATQQLKNGTAVSKKNLQPGDLVFFNSSNSNPARATHVGIYIGSGKFIHASSPKTGVIISNLNTAYYTRVYTTARRIL